MSERRNLAVASLIALSLGCAGAASAQEIKLTLADQNSPTAWGPSHALQPWVKQVEEATKGRVKIEVYPSQTLIKGVDMWKGIRSGIADIGWCVQGYWPEQTPLSDVMSLPFLPISSAEKGSEALWKLYETRHADYAEESAELQKIIFGPNFSRAYAASAGEDQTQAGGGGAAGLSRFTLQANQLKR